MFTRTRPSIPTHNNTPSHSSQMADSGLASSVSGVNLPSTPPGYSRRSLSFDSTEYSFDHAKIKIQFLAERGFEFIGKLPTYADIPKIARSPLVRYGFVRNNSFYLCRGCFFLSPASFNAAHFDEWHEPLLGGHLTQVMDGNFIYLIIKERHDDLVVFFRENASLSGHKQLAGPYGELVNTEHKTQIVGGELYYFQGRLLLNNNKSNSFHTSAEQALGFIRAVWGEPGVQSFFPAVEADEVNIEVQKRTALVLQNIVERVKVPIVKDQEAALPTPLAERQFTSHEAVSKSSIATVAFLHHSDESIREVSPDEHKDFTATQGAEPNEKSWAILSSSFEKVAIKGIEDLTEVATLEHNSELKAPQRYGLFSPDSGSTSVSSSAGSTPRYSPDIQSGLSEDYEEGEWASRCHQRTESSPN